MKRLVMLMLMAMLAVTIVGCGGKNTDDLPIPGEDGVPEAMSRTSIEVVV